MSTVNCSTCEYLYNNASLYCTRIHPWRQIVEEHFLNECPVWCPKIKRRNKDELREKILA